MATPTTQATTGTANGSKGTEKKDRKPAVRIARTDEEVYFSKLNNVLKRAPEAMRPRLIKTLTALYVAS